LVLESTGECPDQQMYNLTLLNVYVFLWFQVAMNPDNTVFDAKRLIGRRYDDPSVQSDVKLWPFKLINDGGKPKIRVEYKSETKSFFAEEISSMVLVKMKEIAEAYLGKVCTDNVIVLRCMVLVLVLKGKTTVSVR